MAKDNEIDIVITADDKASKVIAGISEFIGKAAKAVSNLTEEYTAYGDQVIELSSITRMSTTETSRMIQMADDAYVEYNSLQIAMKAMVKNGVQPSIEGLAGLSDQFLAIESPLEQSQFLVKNFKGASEEMANMMSLGGVAIRQMSSDVSNSLIIDQQKVEAIRQNKKAVDDFNDSLLGMRYEAAANLLNVFQGMPKPLQDATLAIGMFVDTGILSGLSDMAITLNLIGKASPGLQAAATSLGGVAASVWATVAPVLAVSAAILTAGYAVAKLVEFFGMLGDMFNQLNAKGLTGEFLKQLLFTPGAIGNAIAATASIDNILPGRATGGPVSKGRAYKVGESGPETFIPRSDGTIIPNGMNVASGGSTIVINYSPAMSLASEYEFKTKFAPLILDAIRGKV